MTETQAIAAQQPRLPIEQDIGRIANAFAQSGFFNDSREVSQALVKILAGKELGLAPVASMTGIYIVKGKIMISAVTIGGIIKRSGRYDYKVVSLDNDECTIDFFEKSTGGKLEKVGTSTFTRADAVAAGVTGNETYKKYGRNMMFSRAMSNGAKWFTPDIFGGPIYGEGEIEDEPPQQQQPQQTTTSRVAEQPAIEAARPVHGVVTNQDGSTIDTATGEVTYLDRVEAPPNDEPMAGAPPPVETPAPIAPPKKPADVVKSLIASMDKAVDLSQKINGAFGLDADSEIPLGDLGEYDQGDADLLARLVRRQGERIEFRVQELAAELGVAIEPLPEKPKPTGAQVAAHRTAALTACCQAKGIDPSVLAA